MNIFQGEIVLANIKSAVKRIRTSKRNEMRNRQFKSIIKTNIKKVFTCEDENRETALRYALGLLDRAVNKGIIKRNTADRRKSAITKKYNRAVAM